METRFTQFLRSGGNGEFLITRKGNAWVGMRTALSIKNEFPNHAALREDFARRLDEVIASNTAMLLQSLAGHYDPPLTTEDLPDVGRAKADTLALWEERIAVIWTEWHSHLQRLRPIREAMEQHLLRGFAGLVNELRQRGLGIRHYVWRSRDDGKVRSAHAQYDDRVFSWDDPPEGGHPGQAFNCRCHAEPLPTHRVENVVSADFPLPADGTGIPGAALGRRLAAGLIARTPAGLALYAALEASGGLQGFTEAASEQRVISAAAIIGADLGTVEGLSAAITYARAREAASTGGLAGVPKDGPGAEIFAQGMALLAMADPERLSSLQGFQEAARRVESIALQAWEDGRLRPRDGMLADGWAEVFPELTEGERRLGQLPGFTPERLDQFREEYPAEVLGLPDHTGGAPEDAPVGNVISTPMPEEELPNVVEARGDGDFTTPAGNVIREHGKKGTGEEYMLEKGHTAESVDEIIANPVEKVPSSRGDTSTGGKQGATILFGHNGDWVLVNDVTGVVIAINDRFLRQQEPPY